MERKDYIREIKLSLGKLFMSLPFLSSQLGSGFGFWFYHRDFCLLVS